MVSYNVTALRLTTDPVVLRHVYNVGSIQLQEAVLENDYCPEDIVDEIMSRYHPSSSKSRNSIKARKYAAIANRTRNKDRDWDALYASGIEPVLVNLSRNTHTPSRVLTRLSRRASVHLRRNTFENPSTPHTAILREVDRMTSKANWWITSSLHHVSLIVTSLGRSSATVEERKEILDVVYGHLNDAWGATRYVKGYTAARNGFVDVSVRLLNDAVMEPDLVEYIYNKTVASGLALESGETIRWQSTLVIPLLGHPSLPEHCLKEAGTTIIRIRPGTHITESYTKAVLGNRSCPASVLEEACYHPAAWLRALAKKHPNCPEHARIVVALQEGVTV